MSERFPISPDGARIDIRPIARAELGRVLLRCWPDGGKIETLFKTQETIGFGAWDGERCIAQLHCYRVTVAENGADLWPAWSKPDFVAEIVDGRLGIPGPVWCLSCFHVGRSIESFAQSDAPEPRYFHRGIGTALARQAVAWARGHGYAAVVAPGTPDGLFAFSVWAGGLPWTTYSTLGFHEIPRPVPDGLPDWMAIAPPDIRRAIDEAVAAGRPERDFHSRLMRLPL